MSYPLLTILSLTTLGYKEKPNIFHPLKTAGLIVIVGLTVVGGVVVIVWFSCSAKVNVVKRVMRTTIIFFIISP